MACGTKKTSTMKKKAKSGGRSRRVAKKGGKK